MYYTIEKYCQLKCLPCLLIKYNTMQNEGTVKFFNDQKVLDSFHKARAEAIFLFTPQDLSTKSVKTAGWNTM